MASSFQNERSLSRPLNVAVIGGGIGGLALTISLINSKTIKPHIYESAAQFSEIGAGVASGANAVRALGLIDPRLLAAYQRCATYDGGRSTNKTWLRIRRGMLGGPRGKSMDGRKSTQKYDELHLDLLNENPDPLGMGIRSRSCVHRAHFLDEMVKLVPKECTTFGKHFSRYEIVPEEDREEVGGAVRIFFKDGTSAVADALIGCDGIKSAVRTCMLEETGCRVEPAYTGAYAYRALVPTEKANEMLGDDQGSSGNIYTAYEGYSTNYPVAKNQLLNVIVIHNDERENWPDEQWTVPASKETMLEDLEGWHPGLLSLLCQFSSFERWAIFHLPHGESYTHSSGLISLMGDAAHASSPHLGSGAGMAMEDAFVLGELLKQADQYGFPKVLRAYDEVRRQRTQMVVNHSFKANGVMQDMCRLKAGAGEELSRLYHDIWDHDLQAAVERGKEIMDGGRYKL